MHTSRTSAAGRRRAARPATAPASPSPARSAIAVVTEDPALADALRRATPERTVMTVATPLALADLLLQEHTAVLVVDSATLGRSAALLIDRLAAQFPELPLIAVGSREDEAALAAQLSAGRVYRFLHRPASVERARTFVHAALRRAPGPPATAADPPPRRPGRLTWAVSLAALAACALGVAHLLAPAGRSAPAARHGAPAADHPAGAAPAPVAPPARRVPARMPAATRPPLLADALVGGETVSVDPPVPSLAPDLLLQPPVSVEVEAAPPRRLVAPPPRYPPAARRDGREGWVGVTLAVAADGSVAAATVTGSEPRGVFDAAALAAVRQWRYATTAAAEVHERLVFRLR